MDRKDNYVSVVTSLNTWFGSKIMSSDGIILNNALSNFARPWEVEAGSETSSNYMIVGARPLTRSVVALAMDKERICGNRLVTGAAAADGLAEVRNTRVPRQLCVNWQISGIPSFLSHSSLSLCM